MNYIKRYGAVFQMGLADALEYRFDFFTKILLWYFPLIVQILLWKAVFDGAKTSTIGSYSLASMITYYIIAMIVNEIVSPEGTEWSVISDIKDGYLQRYLLQPIDYILFKFIYVISKKVVVILCILINCLPIFFIFSRQIVLNMTMANFMFFLVTLLLGMTIFYLFYVILAMLSFWFMEFSSIFHFLPFAISLLNGAIVPLDLLPEWLEKIVCLSPFYYMVFFPTQVLLENNGDVFGYKALLKPVFWVFVLFIICKYTWQKGLKKFSATGG